MTNNGGGGFASGPAGDSLPATITPSHTAVRCFHHLRWVDTAVRCFRHLRWVDTAVRCFRLSVCFGGALHTATITATDGGASSRGT